MTNYQTVVHLLLEQVKVPDVAFRKHRRAKIAKLAEHMREIGQICPILVDDEYTVIDGVARCHALRLIGSQTVVAIVRSTNGRLEGQSLGVGLNRLQSGARWDNQKLRAALQHGEPGGIEFRLAAFAEGEALSFFHYAKDVAPVIADEAVPRVAREGDIWLLGQHIVGCGTANLLRSQAESASKNSARLALCDLTVSRPDLGPGITAPELLADMFATVRPSSAFCVRLMLESLEQTLAEARRNGFRLLDSCVWTEASGVTKSYRRDHHEFLFFGAGASLTRRSKKVRSSVWRHRPTTNLDRAGTAEPPVSLYSDLLCDFTRPGEAILAPLLGCGTALFAAEKCKRKCIGYEPSATLVDAMLQRWEKQSGLVATHLTGATVKEVSEARALGAERDTNGQ